MEIIKYKNRILGIIIRDKFYKKGANFFTSLNSAFQVGMLIYPRKYKIKPHRHKDLKVVREEPTQEVLYIKKGKVAVYFYAKGTELYCRRIIKTGDLLILLRGAHGFKFLKDSHIIEVKEGPYSEKNKVYLKTGEVK